MPVTELEVPTFQEVPQQALRRLLRRSTGSRPEAMGNACADRSRGANCSTRSEEEEKLVCGAD
jgi:hypothetical protein